MSTWTRWRIAVPLAGLTGLSLAAALTGTIVWWSLTDPPERALSIVISLILAIGFATSISIGLIRTDDIPWLRIGAALLTILITCGLSAFL
jgi:hypothetical protein